MDPKAFSVHSYVTKKYLIFKLLYLRNCKNVNLFKHAIKDGGCTSFYLLNGKCHYGKYYGYYKSEPIAQNENTIANIYSLQNIGK